MIKDNDWLNDPQVDNEVLLKANAEHDAKFGPPRKIARIRPAWKPTFGLVGSKLTDRKIAKYEKLGRYSDQYKEALRELIASKRKPESL